MKKKMVWLTLAVLMLLTLFSACGKKTSGLDVRKLLANDYEVEYIFQQAGMSVDNAKPYTAADGGIYYPVQSDKYKTRADLTKLLAETYATDELVAELMGSVDAQGHPLYMDFEGRLCRSSQPATAPVNPDPDYDTLKVEEQEKGEDGKPRVSFSFLENGGDGSRYSCRMQAVKGKKGGWRLSSTRATAVRQTLDGGTEQGSTAVVQATAHDFVAALSGGDAAALEKLTYAQSGTYSDLAQFGVTDASITSVVEELDFQGEYLVSLTVSGGNGTFLEGTNRYRMQVGYSDYDSIMVVRYFQPEDARPYDLLPGEQQNNPAANQVLNLLTQTGPITFGSPGELDRELITEYALANGSDRDGFTLEELQKAVVRYFNLADFDPGDTRFYSEETKSYLHYGRGGAEYKAFVYPKGEQEGVATVEVQCFDDPLQLKRTRTITYTLKSNGNGSYEFLSAR